MFAFAKVKERVVKKRTVRVDGKVELKVAGRFALVYSFGKECLGDVHAFENGVFAQ